VLAGLDEDGSHLRRQPVPEIRHHASAYVSIGEHR
jgi:hypothetical protein